MASPWSVPARGPTGADPGRRSAGEVIGVDDGLGEAAGSSWGTLCPTSSTRWSYGPVNLARYIDPLPAGVNGSYFPPMVTVGTEMAGAR